MVSCATLKAFAYHSLGTTGLEEALFIAYFL